MMDKQSLSVTGGLEKDFKIPKYPWAWWHTPLIPALREASSLVYKASSRTTRLHRETLSTKTNSEYQRKQT